MSKLILFNKTIEFSHKGIRYIVVKLIKSLSRYFSFSLLPNIRMSRTGDDTIFIYIEWLFWCISICICDDDLPF